MIKFNIVPIKAEKNQELDVKRYDRIGMHISFQKTLIDTIRSGTNEIVKTCQFFLSARRFGLPHIVKEDILATNMYCDQNNISFYIHCPLVVNLANLPDKGYTCMDTSLRIINETSHGALVVHTGSVNGVKQVIDTVSEFDISKRDKFLLENSAGEGTKLGKNWEELYEIFEHVHAPIGLCIDTQHAFGAGMCDFKTNESIDILFENTDRLGDNVLKVVHLNDSLVKFASRVDRHADIGTGYIWYEQYSTLEYLLDKCKERSVDVVLETLNPLHDLAMLYKLRSQKDLF